MNIEISTQAWTPGEPWRRLLATLADQVFFSPLALLLIPVLETAIRWQSPAPLFGIAIFWTWMTLWLIVRFQGTPGKRLMGLRILRVDGTRVGWLDAINRQLLYIVLQALAVLQHAVVLPGAAPDSTLESYLERIASQNPGSWALAGNVGLAVLWGSMMLILLRPDRRAIYDLWSGTVVVRQARTPAIPADARLT